MVMPIITRMVGCRRTPVDFEQKTHRVNDIVRALLQSGQPGEVFPWKHRGMCRDCATLFNRDRIHLNLKGARRYANSLREAPS